MTTVRPVPELEVIVRALAEMDPAVLRDGDWDDYLSCGCCDMDEVPKAEEKVVLADPSRHEPDCPWRMAKEWVSRQTDDKGE